MPTRSAQHFAPRARFARIGIALGIVTAMRSLVPPSGGILSNRPARDPCPFLCSWRSS